MQNYLHLQGDVALRIITKLPDGDKKLIEDKVVAKGEATNHNHCLTGGAELFEIDGKMFVVTNGDGAALEHLTETRQKADHNPVLLERNTCYEVILRNQFNPFAKVFERVID